MVGNALNLVERQSAEKLSLIGWWPPGRVLRNPGVRMRGVLIMRGLRDRGIDVEWFDPARANDYRCVVLMLRHDAETLTMTRSLVSKGCRVILDLCDNHFIFDPANEKQRSDTAVLRDLATEVDHVVTCSPTLTEIVWRECPNAHAVSAIGDLHDDLSVVPFTTKERFVALSSRLRSIYRWRSAAIRGVTQLIWFGDRGGDRLASVGMQDLADRVPSLERLNREHRIHLTVVSNSRGRYRSHFSNAEFPHAFEWWNARSFNALLRRSHIAIIPTSLNDFTRCKSDNRLATALRAGVAVVATALPSYQRYADVAMLDDFEDGLRRYLKAPNLRREHAERGQLLADAWTSPSLIIDHWQNVLENRS